MTTNQLIAMLFPLITAAAVGLTVLFIVKPWKHKRQNSQVQVAPKDTLEEAVKLIRRAERELQPNL
jgi:negative regulator of sigma E activity